MHALHLGLFSSQSSMSLIILIKAYAQNRHTVIAFIHRPQHYKDGYQQTKPDLLEPSIAYTNLEICAYVYFYQTDTSSVSQQIVLYSFIYLSSGL